MLTFIAFISILVAVFALSPNALQTLGVDYVLSSGSALEKIHPATYLSILTILSTATIGGRSSYYVAVITRRGGGVLAFLFTWCIALLSSVSKTGTPITPLVDTFLLPVMVYLAATTLGRSHAEKTQMVLHALFLANSTLLIVELVSGWRLLPMQLRGTLVVNDWRPNGLLGHPLLNATATGCYLVSVMCTPAIRTITTRLALLAFNSLALVAAGGRAAIAGVGIFAGLYWIVNIRAALLNRTIPRHVLYQIALAIPAAAVLLFVLSWFGILDKFLERLDYDRGSAMSRLIAWQLFTSYGISDLLQGIDAMQLADVAERYGLAFGIESFWLDFMLRYGALVAIPFFAALLLFMRSVAAGLSAWAWLPMAYFLLLSSVSLSLSSKNLTFTMLTFMCWAFFHKPHLSARGSRGVFMSPTRLSIPRHLSFAPHSRVS